MPHIHTGPGEHDHTVSAYIIRIDFDEPKILFHMHKKLGKYLHIGGHIEVDETPWQAIHHEIKEESGYDMSQLKILQPKIRILSLTGAVLHPQPVYVNTHKFDDTHFHTDSAYVFVTDQAPQASPLENESEDLSFLSRLELAAIPAGQTFESSRAPGLFALDVCLKEWEPVDPATFGV